MAIRIGINDGLRIGLTDDERPITEGASEDEAYARVSTWIETNPAHPKVEVALRWVVALEKAQEERDLNRKAERKVDPLPKMKESVAENNERVRELLRRAVEAHLSKPR